MTYITNIVSKEDNVSVYLPDVGSCNVDGFGLYPYKKMDPITNNAPTENCKDMLNPKSNTDTMHVMIIAREVANPFRMLSAYFTTTATRSPPMALSMTR